MANFRIGLLLFVPLMGLGSFIGRGWADVGPQPLVTTLLLQFKRKFVGEAISGRNAKRYSVNVYGAGFDSASTVVVDGTEAATEFVSANQLTAKLSGIKLTAGQLSLKVVNADGQSSIPRSIDVVTDPSVLAVNSLSKSNGPIGTRLTLTGIGFTPTGNRVNFVETATPATKGAAAEVDSPDGTTLSFDVPAGLCQCLPPCVGPPCLATTPGQYRIFVSNSNGTSGSASLLVTSLTGPVGIWGGKNIRVTVTDAQITVDGACFASLATTTLVPDQNGNFQVAAFYTFTGGPSPLIPRLAPAQFSGSIGGSTMTLTINIAGSPQPLGPFTLTFGDEGTFTIACA